MGPLEHEPAAQFILKEMTADDVDAATAMRAESWRDTYINDDLGITEEWIASRFEHRLAPEKKGERVARFEQARASGTFNAWVAHDAAGNIIGSTTPFVEGDGTQRLGSLYVDKKWHGKGVGAELIQKAIDWLDPYKPISLEVVTYNERAKAFYRKWGFEEVADSEKVYDEKIPEITMTRPPENSLKQGEA